MQKPPQNTRPAFTLVELIFVIVIIGVLSSFALPKFRGLSSSAKVSAEIATMSSVVTALEAINGEWVINEGSFTWGIGSNDSSELNNFGYPVDLNSSNSTFGRIIKDSSNEYTKQHDSGAFSIFTGPASDPSSGVGSGDEKANKPDKNDYWVYAHSVDKDGCSVGGQRVYPGDFALIDVSETTATDYNVTCTP